MQIIGQVASCLAELHGQGWVHRDLKPGNIMFWPRTGAWTLIDFGLAARVGETARVGFTLAYAAPETVTAHAAGHSSVIADTATDAWALGVMAFELLTGGPAFCTVALTQETVRSVVAVFAAELPLLSLYSRRYKHGPGDYDSCCSSNVCARNQLASGAHKQSASCHRRFFVSPRRWYFHSSHRVPARVILCVCS